MGFPPGLRNVRIVRKDLDKMLSVSAMPRQRSDKLGIPIYELYGETDESQVPPVVHAETISHRSLPSDWRIAPHRHAALYQALLITTGEAVVVAEQQRLQLRERSLVWVPPLCVHGYEFAPGTSGIVISIPSSVLSSGFAFAPSSMRSLDRFCVLAGPSEPVEWTDLERLTHAILAEYRGTSPGRAAQLVALATILAIWTLRRLDRSQAQEPLNAASDTVPAAVRRFLELVESNFADPRPLAQYARQVNVSTAHLNRLCREATGRSPLRIIQDRKIVEAQRLLVFTGLPVGQVADRIGFEDAAYFSRFFRSRTGLSPVAYRRFAAEVEPTDAS